MKQHYHSIKSVYFFYYKKNQVTLDKLKFIFTPVVAKKRDIHWAFFYLEVEVEVTTVQSDLDIHCPQ